MASTNSGYIYHRLVVGYHGCDKTTAHRVLLDHAPLEPSQNSYDWLGKGIYFWEHGYQRALEWAQWKCQRGEFAEAAVLGAYIHLGRCFDLTDTAATHVLREYYEGFRTLMTSAGEPMPTNRAASPDDFDLVLRDLDCAVLNFALSDTDELQTVRGVFVEGDQAYPDARIYTKTHVQIAVRDASCILGYFLPAAPYTS